MLVCDTCDKGYHTFCMRPQMITIPKDGWKCPNCRICIECGGQTNNLQKWHLNFTLCDTCYQHKIKASSICIICKKSYRQTPTKQLRLCCTCNRYEKKKKKELFIYNLFILFTSNSSSFK